MTIMISRIIIAGVLVTVGGLILSTYPSKAPAGWFGWVAAIVLTLGAIATVREHLMDRAERAKRTEQAEGSQETRIKVMDGGANR